MPVRTADEFTHATAPMSRDTMYTHIVPPLCRNFSFFALTFLWLAWTASMPGISRAADPADITGPEWTIYLNDPRLKDADQRLNATYREIMSGLAPQEKRILLRNQRAWIKTRNKDAYARHAKGSPEYIRVLADATAKREAELRADRSAVFTPPVPGAVVVTPASAPVRDTVRPAPDSLAPSLAPDTIPPAFAPGKIAARSGPEKPEARPAPDNAAQQLTPDTVVPQSVPQPVPQTTAPRPVKAPAASVAAPQAIALAPKPKEPAVAREPKPEEKPAAPVPPGTPPFAARQSRPINITPAQFAASYNLLAYSLNAATFPPVPTGVTGGGKTRTEQYPVTGEITIHFKYTNGQFDKPEIITFLGRRFMTGSGQQRAGIAHALFALMKTLHQDSRGNERTRDAELTEFVDSLTGAFTADASRVWKYDGLVYVITYMKKDDLFAMAVNADSGRSRAAPQDR